MKNSNNQSIALSTTASNVSIALLVIAFLGFVDAAYLTVHHYMDVPLPCTILNGCEVVTTSAYSTLGPIPIALLGTLYYMSVFFLILFYREMHDRRFLFTAASLVGTAFAVSVWLVYLQGFVLHSWCQYCLISAIFTTILTALIFTLFVEKKTS